MLEASLVASRFAHYIAAAFLFGLALFPFYSRASAAEEMAASFSDWWARSFLWAAFGSLVSAIAWLVVTTANMNDDWRAVADPVAQMTVMHDTAFGRLWVLRLFFGVLILGVALWQLTKRGAQKSSAALFFSGASLILLAGTGHTRESQGLEFIVHVGADIGHLLAAGAWLGGLFALAFLIKRQLPDADDSLNRFSGIGSFAVATLIASGLVNSWFLVGSLDRLLTTPYGQLLLIKLCLFCGMLVLATANRFWLVPSLAHNRSASLTRLKRHIYGEQILGIFVLLIVAIIGTIEPAIAK